MIWMLIALTLAAWGVALIAFLEWRRTLRTSLLYMHLALLIAPLLLIANHINCSMGFISSLLALCTSALTKLALYALPPAMLLSFLAGYFILPKLYRRTFRAQECTHPALARIRTILARPVRLFALDIAKPMAFALHDAIYISAGMFDILTPKQAEAVLLHETNHIMRQSGLRLFSAAFAQHFSPLVRFADTTRHTLHEERIADAFAAGMQGTWRHLKAAKQRVRAFYRLQHIPSGLRQARTIK